MNHTDQAPLSTAEVAALLGVSTDRVRQLAREGRLDYSLTPYGRLFDPAEVQRVADRRRAATEQPERIAADGAV